MNLSPALVPAAVALTFALGRKYLRPKRPNSLPDEQALYDLVPDFLRLNWKINTASVVFGLAFAGGAWYLQSSLNRWLATTDQPAQFTLLPTPAMWWFLPLFGGLTAPSAALRYALPWIWGEKRASAYFYWKSLDTRFDSWRMCVWMFWLIAVPIALATSFVIPVHAVFRPSDFRLADYAELRDRVYRYDQIRSIIVTDGGQNRNGEFISDPHIVLELADGSEWSSRDLRDPVDKVDEALVAFLSQKADLEVSRVHIR